MGFQFTVTADMRDQHAVLLQLVAHQNRAVADQRIVFRAHQRQAIASSASQHALDTCGERGQLRDAVVARAAVDVTLRLLASGAELAAQKHIMNARRLQTTLRGLPGKMGEARTVGSRSHVHDGLNLVTLQLRDEFVHGLGGMPNGVDLLRERRYVFKAGASAPVCQKTGLTLRSAVSRLPSTIPSANMGYCLQASAHQL